MKTSDLSTLKVLRTINIYGAKSYTILLDYGYPEKIIYSKYDKLDRDGLIDYGVSLRTAWLTDKGKAYLEELTHENEIIEATKAVLKEHQPALDWLADK